MISIIFSGGQWCILPMQMETGFVGSFVVKRWRSAIVIFRRMNLTQDSYENRRLWLRSKKHYNSDILVWCSFLHVRDDSTFTPCAQSNIVGNPLPVFVFRVPGRLNVQVQVQYFLFLVFLRWEKLQHDVVHEHIHIRLLILLLIVEKSYSVNGLVQFEAFVSTSRKKQNKIK